MRKQDMPDDFTDDQSDELSGIRATEDERAYISPSRHDDMPEAGVRAPVRPEPAQRGTGGLWALCAALALSLIGFGYWSHQQQTRLQQQLVATQNSFARISEDAAGQIEDITGKVTATESSLSELDALDRRIDQLSEVVGSQGQLLEQVEQGGTTLKEHGSKQQQRLDEVINQTAALTGRLDAYDENASALAGQLSLLNAQVMALSEGLEQLAPLEAQLDQQAQQLATQQQTLATLNEQVSTLDVDAEIAALRRQLEERMSLVAEEIQSIDSFRLQTNRALTRLQTQLRAMNETAGQP
ncbi:MAG: hypothetical protein V7772_18660 [Pseudomonas profundi]|uniref:hypothetical protein n=1 Tax=Pseudomonas profundi TaxID=1981513 RepID=UPI0030021E87